MEIPILYNDQQLLICEKPAGILSESPGLPELILKQTGKPVFPVHRLDRGTGGTIILAKTPAACAALQKMFQQDMIHKEYFAVISGSPTEKSGKYKDFLYHDKTKNKTYVVTRKRAGVREAVCLWELLGTAVFEDHALSLVRVILHTGRTHQIRVQFASRGMPLVGDRRYGSTIKAGFPSLWASGVGFSCSDAENGFIRAISFPPPVFPWNLFSVRNL